MSNSATIGPESAPDPRPRPSGQVPDGTGTGPEGRRARSRAPLAAPALAPEGPLLERMIAEAAL